MRQTQLLVKAPKRTANRDDLLRQAHQDTWKKFDEARDLGIARRATMAEAIEELIDACEEFIATDH